MDYSRIKAAMAEFGHKVSEGTEWTPADAAAWRTFSHFTLGVAHDVAHYLIQFPEHFENELTRLGVMLHLRGATPPAQTEPLSDSPVVTDAEAARLKAEAVDASRVDAERAEAARLEAEQVEAEALRVAEEQAAADAAKLAVAERDKAAAETPPAVNVFDVTPN